MALEPWHEESHRQLMWLLAASGQRSEALTQYEACRHLLDEELGVEPSAETMTLYEQIKDDKVTKLALSLPKGWQREDDAVTRWQGDKVISVAAPAPHNLPPQLTPFIGREAEVVR